MALILSAPRVGDESGELVADLLRSGRGAVAKSEIMGARLLLLVICGGILAVVVEGNKCTG